jgi:YebC/PmpR family DNA-binding regulatory protein
LATLSNEGLGQVSGHSKWSTIKRKKARVDAQRGKVFTRLSREIIVAARQGGSDPESNTRLKAAIQRAKEANIPNENINRAIQKGVGDFTGERYEEITYEGYGPGGVAVMVEALTDNRNRTAGEIRYLFTRNGGSLGESGCVAWLFQEKGLIIIERGGRLDKEEDELMLLALEAGAEDFKAEEDSFEIVTSVADLSAVKEALAGSGRRPALAEKTVLPQNYIKLGGEEAEKVLRLIEALEEHEDVQNVYTNIEILGK